jgi:CHAT domain-containing protein
VLDYAIVGDTLLTWLASAHGVKFNRDVVPRDSLIQTVQRVRSALELGASEAHIKADLARLSDWLVRPISGALGDSTVTLAVVADGEIAGVPFAALRDSTGAYLIERNPIRFENSFRDATLVDADRDDRRIIALLANPDAQGFADLAPLRAATDEVTRIAALYEPDRVLTRTSATRPEFMNAMARAEVLHFAGHAVFDTDRPERSFVVLAPDSLGQRRAGRLTAREIAAVDLRGMRLVVLSACETLPGRQGRAAGVSGLAAALLVGGVGGVVGTDWRVDDRLARDLMVVFHREYRTLGDGPRALRAAQLEMLRSQEPANRSPASWAGFRYAGN